MLLLDRSCVIVGFFLKYYVLQQHPQVGHVKRMKTRKYTKMNLINLLLHLDKRTTTPTTMKKNNKKKTMKRMFHPDPNKSSHVLEQESQETIPSNKSLMISKPGELLPLKLVWLIFMNIIHSSLSLNL